MKFYRVDRHELAESAREERKEHPWASQGVATRIARDHLREYGPGYVRTEGVSERIAASYNAKHGIEAHAPRKPATRQRYW